MFRDLFPWAAGVSAIQQEMVRLARLGRFQAVDPNIDEAVAFLASGRPAEQFRALFTAAGIRVGVWYLPCYTDFDDAAFSSSLATLRKTAPAAQTIGITRAGTVVRPWSDTRPYRENFDFAVSRLKPIAEILAEHGIRLGLEYVGPLSARAGHPYEFIHTQAETITLCDAIGTGTAGLTLDSFHWYTSGGTLDDLKALDDSRIVIVHVNDAPDLPMDQQAVTNRALPGETGVIDLVGFLRTLRDIGYTGPVAPEPFSLRLRSLPAELAVCLLGGYFAHVWDEAFSDEASGPQTH